MFLRFNQFLTAEEADKVYAHVLDTQEDKLKTYQAGHTTYTGLTALYHQFNWMPEFKDILNIDLAQLLFKTNALESYDELWVQCWCNAWSQGEGINMHCHASADDIHTDFMVGHIFIGGDTRTGTYYGELNQTIPSVKGELHLIGPWDEHKVVLNTSRETRVSVAMDIWYKEPTWLLESGKILHVHKTD